MGQIPNKTYTAPDGSVYRVEADGSVTKIKGGRVQSNEPPSKYNITPDGKIYRVESDGSVTYLGNVEERIHSQQSYSTLPQEPKKKSHAWVWIIIVLVVAGIGGAIAFSSINDYAQYTQEEETEQPQYTEPSPSEKYNFPETTIYYGHEGDLEDGEYVKMFFWTDGTCKIFEENVCESRECGGKYYIENDTIHVTWGDNTYENFDISNDSFSRYGITLSRIYEGDKTLEEFPPSPTEIPKLSSKGYLIFSSTSRIYCNGIYPYDSDNAKFFSCNLSGINKNHFSIDFEFNPQESGTEVLMLSDSYRILGIFLSNDGSIGITTDNHRHYYNTPYIYTLNEWNSLCVEYNNGDLYINSFKIPIVIENLYEGDNNLSSINYSNGRAFTGEISNIYVISY